VDWLKLTYASSPLLFWLLGSILLCTLGTNLLWLIRATDIQESPYGRGFAQALRFLFFLGIPYLTLGGWPRHPFQGLLSLEDLGLVGLSARWPATRWLGAAGTAAGLGLAALLLLALAWANARRAGACSWLRFPPRPWWVLLGDVLYLEVHWAFYRSALALSMDNWYPAVFLGLVLIYLEWSLDPFWRQGWHSKAHATAQWLRSALALVVALLFLLTRNLWACLAVHLLLELALRRLGPAPAVAQTS
jgi:hypothetical protein